MKGKKKENLNEEDEREVVIDREPRKFQKKIRKTRLQFLFKVQTVERAFWAMKMFVFFLFKDEALEGCV